MAKAVIIGIYIEDRIKEAGEIQKILTEFGCSIKTRLGLHEAGNTCSPSGIILLELTGAKAEWEKFEVKLKGIAGVQIQKLEFV
ncbi:MAG: hypothetical protein JW982_15445 [Spirochaetes bacterium]|nr:hypothetical protein [Spirochaetota bacterium]